MSILKSTNSGKYAEPITISYLINDLHLISNAFFPPYFSDCEHVHYVDHAYMLRFLLFVYNANN